MSEASSALDWYRGDGVRRAPRDPAWADRAQRLRERLEDPSGYRPSERTRDAVNVALLMNLPLLVAGEPGSGKTQLGFAIAHELGLPRPSIFVTKSTSQARDLFYTYDAIRHFHASQTRGDPSAAPFIQLQALGQAIFRGMDQTQRAAFGDLTKSDEASGQSLVIVDEIDKAPRDFANDLLYEFDQLRFRIPELDNLETPRLAEARRPLLLVTTNSEQLLPEAFVRRCVFLHLEAPRGAELAALIEQRFSGILGAEHPLLTDVVDFSDALRARGQLDRPPSSAELLQFLAAILAAGADPARGLREQPTDIRPYFSLLAKSAADAERLASGLGA